MRKEKIDFTAQAFYGFVKGFARNPHEVAYDWDLL